MNLWLFLWPQVPSWGTEPLLPKRAWSEDRRGCDQAKLQLLFPLPSLHFPICEMGHMLSLPANNSFHRFTPVISKCSPHTLIKGFQMETLTLPKGLGGGGVLPGGALACPGLEIQPEPGSPGRARLSLSQLASLEAVGEGRVNTGAPDIKGMLVPWEERRQDRVRIREKEAEVPGLRGLSQRSVGPNWGVTSGRAVPRMPPVPLPGPSPCGGCCSQNSESRAGYWRRGSWRPCGLGDRKAGRAKLGRRPAAAALDLSFLSIQHLTKKQINSVSQVLTAMLPARLWVLAPLCSSQSPPMGAHLCLDPLPFSTHPPLTSAAAHGGPQVSSPSPFPPGHACLCSLSGLEINPPTLAPSGP